MNLAVELPESDFARLKEAAAAEGLTPAEWIGAHLPAHVEVQACSNGRPPESLADLFAGHIGRFSSGHGKPRIEDLRASFGEYLEAKYRAGHL